MPKKRAVFLILVVFLFVFALRWVNLGSDPPKDLSTSMGYYSDPGGSESLFGALFVVHLLLSNPNRDPLALGTLKSWISEAGFKNLEVFALTERSTCLTAVK